MLKITKFNKIIAANWKLNGSLKFIETYFDILKSIKIDNSVCGIIFPPNIYLQSHFFKSSTFYFGAQDCSNFNDGAYTGEISALMIKENNCQFCLVGHSERRRIFHQKNKDFRLKINNLINAGVNPIYCIGESLEERKKGITKDVLKKQIIESIPQNYSNNIVIAYEPIWAIGTGMVPTLEEINSIHNFIKMNIKNYENFKILYGGSVKSTNAREIMDLDNVDGVLVGGASLDAFEFSKILLS